LGQALAPARRRRGGPAVGRHSRNGAIRCAIYTRSSIGPESGLRHFSADAQREVAEALIARRSGEGWTALPERYDDTGLSGRDMDRPALSRLLADAVWGAMECVVVYRVDRLSRSFLDFGRILGLLSASGVGFVSATEPFDTRDTTGHLMLNMLEAFAQFERETLSERLRDKIGAMRRKGKHIGGLPPFGYRLDVKTGRLVADEREAAVVREVFALYLEHRSTIRVAAELNRRGERSRAWTTKAGRRRGGVAFSPGRVQTVLTQMTYAGEVVHKGRVFPGEQEALVPSETFNAAAELLARNLHGPRYLSLDPDGALLGGILRCRSCGGAMGHFQSVGRGRRCLFYVCGNARARSRGLCPATPLRAEPVERAVLDALWGLAADREQLRLVLEEAAGRGVEGAAAGEESVRDALSALRRNWDGTGPAERHGLLRVLISRVDCESRDGTLRVRLSPEGLGALVSRNDGEGGIRWPR